MLAVSAALSSSDHIDLPPSPSDTLKGVENQLIQRILSNYSRYGRPIADISRPVHVSISFYLTQLMSLVSIPRVTTGLPAYVCMSCMFVRPSVWMSVRPSACLYLCMYVCVYMYICMSVCTGMHVYMHVIMCAYTYVCIYVSMYLYIYVSMYVFMYLCMDS